MMKNKDQKCFEIRKIQYKWLPGSSTCEAPGFGHWTLEFVGPQIREKTLRQCGVVWRGVSAKVQVTASGCLEASESLITVLNKVSAGHVCVCVYKVKLQINNYFLVVRLGHVKKKKRSNRTSQEETPTFLKPGETLSVAWSLPSSLTFIAHDNSVVISGGWLSFDQEQHLCVWMCVCVCARTRSILGATLPSLSVQTACIAGRLFTRAYS